MKMGFGEKIRPKWLAFIMQHFDNIFRTSLPENIEEAVAHVPNLISQEVNDTLTSEFTAREVG
jgi:hypothetical protein